MRQDNKALCMKSAMKIKIIREHSATIQRDGVVFELETIWGSEVIPCNILPCPFGVLYTGLLYYKNDTNRDI
jgi:hypothetical protein